MGNEVMVVSTFIGAHKAMQIGLAKKEKRAEELKKRAAELKQMARDKGGNKRVKTTKGAGGSSNKKQKKK